MNYVIVLACFFGSFIVCFFFCAFKAASHADRALQKAISEEKDPHEDGFI